MFESETLKNHLQTSSVIKTQSAIIAEWNMNFPENISKIGNYRYRPLDDIQSQYGSIPNTYDADDAGNFYTNATDADIVIDAGVDESDNLMLFSSIKQKEKLLYSLEDCFGRFRPRSGINKIRYGVTKFLHHSNPQMASRPRYYMGHKDDIFKYWTSYRTENNIERGISNKVFQGKYFIDDASPFVVYKDQVPANRVVIKMQTNIGTETTGNSVSSAAIFNDPLYGAENSTTPKSWRIQYLLNNSWVDAKVFEETSVRLDGSPIIGPDGYVELVYGLIIPDEYSGIFIDNGVLSSTQMLPITSSDGNAFLVVNSRRDIGKYYVWINGGYRTFVPKYDWYLLENGVSQNTGFVTNLGSPLTYVDPTTGRDTYRELAYISGIRVVVDTMNKLDSPLDIIEISPRLSADISDMVTGFNISKPASDLGAEGLPVGQLLAATGSLSIFDVDQAFNENNLFSVIGRYLNKNLQIKFYEVICDVDGQNHYVPIKTMFSEQMPTITSKSREVSVTLRDLYFYFESLTAPQLLIPDVSTSYAISTLLDSIGFSNYIFKRLDGEQDTIIPYFYVGPNESVAQVLEKIAISTQTAMFFDEDNNFVCMSKGYLLPENGERPVDFVLSGSSDSVRNGALKNQATSSALANLISISSYDKNVFNDGKVNYTTRYIQKTQASIKQAYLSDRNKTWVYKPSLLWEVTASETTKSVNEQSQTAQAFALSAVPLNSDLSSQVPSVVNYSIENNVIDLGEGIYWLGRYNGYLYSNGEIIKFDAIEYSVSGVSSSVWITSVQEYQNYFSKISFNGKMYPTGRVRIYSEPNYETIEGITRISNGPVAKHGRGQFGTTITSHTAGIDPYWKSNDNVRGCQMQSSILLGNTSFGGTLSGGPAGVSNEKAKKATRTDLIKNYLSSTYSTEISSNSASAIESDSVQSSALVFEGPSFETSETPIDFISYIHKPVNSTSSLYKHFGTRMRIIGKIENSETAWQSASGSMTYYNADSSNPEFSNLISGGSGGIAVSVNSDTNVGYYYEIVALDAANADYFDATGTDAGVANILFYKIMSDSSGNAIPIKLWSGLTNILVDSGNFVGQERVYAQDTQTVYDLAVEYENVGSSRKFYLYLNDSQVATVIDQSPLPEYPSMAMFVRGSSKCMFEHVYALSNNYSQNSGSSIGPVAASIFSNKEITANEAFNKYAVSGIIQSTYLSGINSSDVPKYNLYFDEFGSIMREAAYFNIKYDKAYPALYAKISPTFNKLRAYTVSGFQAGAYGAEFLVFNASNTTLTLNEQTGNYLRIQGITFTQSSENELTVDDYYDKVSDFSNPQIEADGAVGSIIKEKQSYKDIKYSRKSYGSKEFSLSLDYIQSRDAASDLMGWLSKKIMVPRKSVGAKIFATPTIQLGDILSIDYSSDNIYQISDPSKLFVVYNIEYAKTSSGPEMTVYMSEV